MALPYKKIFINIGEKHELAEIGHGSLSSQYYYYTIGYLEAANEIIERTLNHTQNLSDYMMSENLNTSVIPACFLYRQYLELTLKDIFIQFSGSNNDQIKKFIQKSSHNLKKIWKCSKPIIELVIFEDDIAKKSELEKIESYILEFAEEDPSSFKYRYPNTTQYEHVFSDKKIINIKRLKECINEIECFFSRGIFTSLEIRKWKNECDQYRNKALELINTGLLGEALLQFEKAFECKKKWSENHPDLIILFFEIGETYFNLGDNKNALSYYKRSLELNEKLENKVLTSELEFYMKKRILEISELI